MRLHSLSLLPAIAPAAWWGKLHAQLLEEARLASERARRPPEWFRTVLYLNGGPEPFGVEVLSADGFVLRSQTFRDIGASDNFCAFLASQGFLYAEY